HPPKPPASLLGQKSVPLRNDPRYHVEVVSDLVGMSDGVTPLAVQHGNEAAVGVAYLVEGAAGQNVHSATLTIIGNGWNPISVPVSAVVGLVKAEVPNATLSVQQGRPNE